jgi:UDP-N-acetylmuramoyl-tripeptide--D-alanyl-D-alanine ligase
VRPIPFNILASLLKLSHPSQTLIQGVAIDSRKITVGDLFFALPGSRVDGHAFLKEAALKGASGAVIREDYLGEDFGLPLLRVADVLGALQDLARKMLTKRRSQVIAITGSLGKTTTKTFAAALLGARYRVFASPLSYNSQATLPLSILMANGDEDFLILEMGMTHEGDIKKLISIAPPDIALITTVAVQHAVNFKDGLAGISREKSSIFGQTKTRLGLVHHDIFHHDAIANTGNCPKKTFSLTNRSADYFLEVLPKSVRVHIQRENPYECTLTLPAQFHYHNFLAAASLAHSLAVPWALICETAPTLQLPPMRFELVEKQGILFVNDAYNANPDAIQAALAELPKPKPGKKTIAILSEMDALGTYSEEGHTRVAETAIKYADYLLCLGSRCETMCLIWKRQQKPVQLFASRAELGHALKTLAEAGDVVLLKGARSYALDLLLQEFEDPLNT